MLEHQYTEDILLCQALNDLNTQMASHHLPKIHLRVIGGFALLLQNIRNNRDSYTDIDYIGEALTPEIQTAVQQIGMKYGFGAHWINNDVLLPGSTLSDLEYSTGPLHFDQTLDYSHIHIDILSKEDLLRMKVIAIDTSLSAIQFGGDFTRRKDLNDILLLMKDLNYTVRQILAECENYIYEPYTKELLSNYLIRETEEERQAVVDDFLDHLSAFTLDQLSQDDFDLDGAFEPYDIPTDLNSSIYYN